MKNRNLIFLSLMLMVCMLLVACKKDSDNTIQDDPTMLEEGQIISCEFYVDNVLRESMIDTVINLGSKELPALFHSNSKHTLDGIALTNGNHYLNVFRSLTRMDLYKFIVIWGRLMGLEIDLSDPSPESIARRQLAFHDLFAFLISNDVDFPLLVSLCKDSTELNCAKRWIDAASELKASGTYLEEFNSPNNIFKVLERSGTPVSELSSAVQSAGFSEKDFLWMAQNKGAAPVSPLMQFDSPRQAQFIALIIGGICFMLRHTVRLIENSQAYPNLDDEYASYLNYADTNVMAYYARKDTISPIYTAKYTVGAEVKFYVETNYDAYHSTLPGQYVNRSGMIVTSIKRTWPMAINGSTTYEAGSFSGTEENPVSTSSATVSIIMSESKSLKKTATLLFEIRGDMGYKQLTWDPGSK